MGPFLAARFASISFCRSCFFSSFLLRVSDAESKVKKEANECRRYSYDVQTKLNNHAKTSAPFTKVETKKG